MHNRCRSCGEDARLAAAVVEAAIKWTHARFGDDVYEAAELTDAVRDLERHRAQHEGGQRGA